MSRLGVKKPLVKSEKNPANSHILIFKKGGKKVTVWEDLYIQNVTVHGGVGRGGDLYKRSRFVLDKFKIIW